MATKKKYSGLKLLMAVLRIIDNFVIKYTFTPIRIRSNLSDKNINKLCLISEMEIIDKPEKYIRLGASDFLKIYNYIRQGHDLELENGHFYFSLEELYLTREGKKPNNKKSFICLEKNDSGKYITHVRSIEYLKRPNGHKIICLLR